jgi:hypothetical protein
MNAATATPAIPPTYTGTFGIYESKPVIPKVIIQVVKNAIAVAGIVNRPKMIASVSRRKGAFAGDLGISLDS